MPPPVGQRSMSACIVGATEKDDGGGLHGGGAGRAGEVLDDGHLAKNLTGPDLGQNLPLIGV
jgi:hypothetical protein